MRSKNIIIYIVLIVMFIAKTISFFAIVAGDITTSLRAFSVDSDGNLYLGKNSSIEVICENRMVHRINPQSSKAYIFKINEDNHILLSTSMYIYEMELDGTILSVNEDSGCSVYNNLQKDKYYFCSRGGDEYRLINCLGRYMIEKNNEKIIYEMPFSDYLCSMINLISGVLLLTCLGILVIKLTASR